MLFFFTNCQINCCYLKKRKNNSHVGKYNNYIKIKVVPLSSRRMFLPELTTRNKYYYVDVVDDDG